MQLVLRYIYSDCGIELLSDCNATRADEKLDHIMLVMAVANELLIDRLKSICSLVARPLGEASLSCQHAQANKIR